MSEERLSRIIGDFDFRNLSLFFRSKCENYAEALEDLSLYDDEGFADFQKLGEIRFDSGDKLVITSSLVSSDLSERSGKKAQYEKAKKILKEMAVYYAGFFIFHDNTGSFRFSLVYAQFQGTKRSFSNFRRFTYFVSKDQTNKTFRVRVGGCTFISLEAVKDAFSVEKVNKEFYNHIARFFYRLTGYECKREMTLPSVSDDDKETYQEFAVRLIGRAIFCWFLKHKKSANGISLIPESILSSEAVKENSQYYHSTLEKLFFEVLNTPQEQRHNNILPDADKIPFLNGGLFEPHKDDFYSGKPLYNLVIPDVWFEQFFEILEQYNFTIDENSTVDADVSVDPEMLGRIFENLLAEVNPETGETARKATGSYYTPRTIVDYMVDQSLKQYLITKTKIGEDKITALLSYEAPEVALSEGEKGSIISALDEIKIIDPACGSGAFPMGILHKMLLVLQKADPDLKLWLKNHLGNIEAGIFKDRLLERIKNENWEYVRKLLIIQKSIYGVDIQTIAVEISKLRFFLSLIVDEQIDDLKKNRGVEALPNLEFKFVAANSLIELPPVINRQVGLGVNEEVTRLKELRNRYLRSYGREKKEIEEDFLKTRGKLIEHNANWGKDALALQLANWDPFSNEKSDWFDPDWMFGVASQFDIVIANPPYDVLDANHPNIKYFEARYEVSKGGKKNLYKLFFERGLDLLRNKGVLTYISPSNYLTSADSIFLRRLFAIKNTIKEIVEYSEADKVFEAVTQAVCTTVLVKSPPSESSFCYIKNNERVLIDQGKIIRDDKHFIKGTNAVIQKMEAQRHKMGEFVFGYQGEINVSTKKEFFRYDKRSASDLPLVRGNHVKRYYTKDFPSEFCPISAQTRNHFAKERVVFQEIANASLARRLNGVIITNALCGHTTNYVFSNSDKVPNRLLLALINSHLLNYYFKFYNQTNHIPIGELKSIPVPDLDRIIAVPFANLVDQILTITKDEGYLSNSAKQAKVRELEHQIDQMVYELYGLTPEETEIVEGR